LREYRSDGKAVLFASMRLLAEGVDPAFGLRGGVLPGTIN
jgi:hypothetical protein